ncbi:hypothetical protein [Rhodovulum euryhalinum]|nr:hypothetical protein [Rhodovulum euryhalinum]
MKRFGPAAGADGSAARPGGGVATVIPLPRPLAAPPVDLGTETLEALDRLLRLLDQTIEVSGLSDNPAAHHHFDSFALEALRIFSDLTAGRGRTGSRG